MPYSRAVAVAPLGLLGREMWEVMAPFARTGGGVTGLLRGIVSIDSEKRATVNLDEYVERGFVFWAYCVGQMYYSPH